MGNLYFTVKRIIKPSKKSLIETIAYLSECKILDESTGRTYYPRSAKHKLISNKMFLPEGAPEGFAKHNSFVCWNDLNKMQYHGVIAYKMIIPFRKDFTDEQNMKIITDWVMEGFVNEGCPVQIFVHDCDAGKHAHLIVSGYRLDGEEWIAVDILDSMYDVIRLIPRINFLKNENGKAYLY